jgi:transcriptional regulator with XRE-family HTH domain
VVEPILALVRDTSRSTIRIFLANLGDRWVAVGHSRTQLGYVPMDVARLQQTPEPSRHSRIGERLREARMSLGISVREVARRAGVSASLVSQIERDKVNPSVATLWELVTVLGLPIGDLFAETSPQPAWPKSSTTSPGLHSVVDLESGVRWEQLMPQGEPGVEFLKIVYPPGAESCDERSLLRHNGREHGCVLSGLLGVRVGFDEYVLGPGMAISFDATAPHRLWSIGDQTAEAIWLVIGRQTDTPDPFTAAVTPEALPDRPMPAGE